MDEGARIDKLYPSLGKRKAVCCLVFYMDVDLTYHLQYQLQNLFSTFVSIFRISTFSTAAAISTSRSNFFSSWTILAGIPRISGFRGWNTVQQSEKG